MRLLRFALFCCAVCACSSSSSSSSPSPPSSVDAGTDGASAPLTDDQHIELITTKMREAILLEIDALSSALGGLRDSAPTPVGRGWDVSQDAVAIGSMQARWIESRSAYERVEGALAPLFPDLDSALDARYDDFLTELLAHGGDANPFDGKGVTGLHAIERILYSANIPQRVVDFESSLPGYAPARYPNTEAEAVAFKNQLCMQALADAAQLRQQFAPAEINIAIAFQGLISLMNEQGEKVTKASTNEEESRYAQRTMADIRDNLQGTTKIYEYFRPWIRSRTNATDPKKDGPTIDGKIQSGFAALSEAYAAVAGDAIPVPPASWSAESPSQADLASPFGQLYSKVNAAIDPAKEGGVVYEMNQAATILGFPQFEQEGDRETMKR